MNKNFKHCFLSNDTASSRTTNASLAPYYARLQSYNAYVSVLKESLGWLDQETNDLSLCHPEFSLKNLKRRKKKKVLSWMVNCLFFFYKPGIVVKIKRASISRYCEMIWWLLFTLVISSNVTDVTAEWTQYYSVKFVMHLKLFLAFQARLLWGTK